MVAPRRYVCLGPLTETLFDRRVFEDIIEDLEIRLSWTSQVGPKSKDDCSYKKRKRHIQRGRPREGRQRLERCGHKLRTPPVTGSWGVKDRCSQTFRGSLALLTTGFWTSGV